MEDEEILGVNIFVTSLKGTKVKMGKVVNMQNKKLNHRKVIITSIITVLVLTCIIIAVIYNSNKGFRDFMDKYIFLKNVSEENLPIIELDYSSNKNVIPYGKYICILADNTLTQYNSLGKQEKQVKIEITNPIYDINGKYLVIGEKNNQKIYLLNGDHIVWEGSIEGNLSKISVNKNGYVSAIVTGTTYKSVIVAFDEKGNELLKSYSSKTIAVDSCISPDNNNLAYAEVSTSGTTIQSKIKVISTAETEPKFTYTANQGSLIMKLKYIDKNQLLCMYDDSIHVMKDDQDTEIMKLNENGKQINFADINLDNFAFRSYEQSTGLFKADTIVEMKSTSGQKESIYRTEDVAKTIKSYGNVIALNLGAEVEFINTSGWLIKRYISSQVIMDIVICDGTAGIIYRDKIELITL